MKVKERIWRIRKEHEGNEEKGKNMKDLKDKERI